MSQFLIRQLIIPDKFINKKSIYWMLLTIATSSLPTPHPSSLLKNPH